VLAFISYTHRMQKLDYKLLIISLALLIIGMVPAILEYSSLFFIFILLTVGIPHGSLDHLIYFKKTGDTANSLIFYSKYITLIILVGICWFIFPLLSFLIFLLISGFHFGQSQLYQFNVGKNLHFIYHLSWGTFLLSIIILFNIRECFNIFNSLEWLKTQWMTKEFFFSSSAISGTTFLVIHTYLFLKKNITTEQYFFELMVLGLLILMSLTTNAVFTFSVYFGLWHSLRSLILEYHTIKPNENYTWLYFLKDVSPYSLIGIAFLASTYLLSVELNLGISIYMIFIIIISMLTVPHLIIMDKLYIK
jgi:Brp/Blh family beta-carotene 15,15'-monooxygenase